MLDPFHQFCHSTVLPQVSTATTPAITVDDTLDAITNILMMVFRPFCSVVSTCSCLFCRIFFKLAIDRERHPTSSKYLRYNTSALQGTLHNHLTYQVSLLSNLADPLWYRNP